MHRNTYRKRMRKETRHPYDHSQANQKACTNRWICFGGVHHKLAGHDQTPRSFRCALGLAYLHPAANGTASNLHSNTGSGGKRMKVVNKQKDRIQTTCTPQELGRHISNRSIVHTARKPQGRDYRAHDGGDVGNDRRR